MATVQKKLLAFAQIIDPTTKKGQKFQDATAALTINGATNASPIVISTTTAHGMATGDQVYIASVGGNTAANNTASNPNWTIINVTTTSFSLTGSTGNGAYTSGGTATGALIGSVDGAEFPRQRLLDMYNQARYDLFLVLKTIFTDTDKLGEEVGALAVNTTVDFGTAASLTDAAKPTGYINFIGLSSSADVPYVLLPKGMINTLRYGNHLDYKQTATNAFVFDVGSNFVSYGTVNVNSGNAYITGSTVKLSYYGITEFTLTDVLGNSTAETYNEQYHQLLLEIAQMISQEQGQEQINAM